MTMRTGRKHTPRVSRHNEWSVVIETHYSYPGKLNVYWNEKYVPPVGRRDEVVAGAAGGSNYFHPASRVLSILVKGSKPTDRVKLG